MDLPTVLRKLVPILGEETVRRYWEQLQLADPRTTRLIEISLRRKLAARTGSFFEEKDPLLAPIPTDRADGPIRLGRVTYGPQLLHAFGLRFDELIRHIGIVGMTGSGKSNIAFLLLRELARHEFPFFVTDWKQNYRHVLGRRGFEDLVVYTVGRDTAPFHFNPLVPAPGVHPKEWMKWISEILATAFFLGHGVKSLLQEAVDQLYRDFGAYDGSGTWPTFRDVMQLLHGRKTKGKESAWMQSTERAMKAVNFGLMDAVVNSGVNFPLQALLKQRAVLELDGLDSDAKTFLIDSLLLWIHHYRMHEGDREKFKHLLLLEEAHHVLSKGATPTANETIIDIIFREVREFGQGICFIDQMPSAISHSAMANSYCMIALNLRDGKDIATAGRAMLLDPDKAKHLGTLPVGAGVIKLQDRWPRPFSTRFPVFPIDKGSVTNEQVRQQYLRSLSVQTATRMMREGMDAFVRLANQTVLKDAHPPESPPREQQHPLTDEERRVLDDVHEHAFSSVTERYRRLCLSARKGNEIKSVLIKQQLLSATAVPLGRSSVSLLELTAVGREFLGLPATETDRHGGIEHRFWIHTIAERLQRTGVVVQKEHPLGGGKTADLLVVRDTKQLAVEVETGKSDWRGNILKYAKTHIESIVTAATRKSVLAQLNAQASKLPLSPEVQIVHVDDVLTVVRAILSTA